MAAIKVYILQKYPTVDALRLNYLLKQALATGLHRGLLIRPVNSKAKGATGSFKLVPKDKRKIPPRKTALRMPGQAEGKDPKKPTDTKAHRKTQPASQSSKPTVTKGENGTSLAKKKMGGKVPKEAAGEGPKAKAPVPPKGAGSKKEPVPLAGKAEASKGPRKPGIPTKSSVSKAASKKAEAEG